MKQKNKTEAAPARAGSTPGQWRVTGTCFAARDFGTEIEAWDYAASLPQAWEPTVLNTAKPTAETAPASGQHTPGPWCVSAACETSVVTEEGKGISHTPICKNHPYFDYEIQVANARLIAAAPELLEALQKLYAATDEQVQSGHVLNAVLLARGSARAAFAKAEGREQ